MGEEKKPKIAIFQENKDICNMLHFMLDETGYQNVATTFDEIQSGVVDLDKLLKEFDPQIVIWDIRMPYDKRYDELVQFSQSEIAKGRRFVLTTAGNKFAEGLGETSPFDVIIRPFDINEVLNTINKDFKKENELKPPDETGISREIGH